MNPIHTQYRDAENLDFPGVITLKILLSGTETNGPGVHRYVFSPALTVEDMFREMFRAQNGEGLSVEAMSEIALKNGQEFVGPPL